MTQQLGGLDTALLYCETPGMHMHVCGIALLDPTRDPEEMYGAIRSLLTGATDRVALMRKRLATVPLGLARPFWVDDDRFSIDRHLHRARLPAPGDDRALARLIGEISEIPLPRDRPLWGVWLVEGLADGRMGLLAKIHHAGIDGAAALAVMSQIFQVEPGAGPKGRPHRKRRAEPSPGFLSLLGTGLANLAKSPVSLATLVPATAGRVGSMAARRWRLDAAPQEGGLF